MIIAFHDNQPKPLNVKQNAILRLPAINAPA
nr:MAG TPA: hypothetical protein [Caudoviricetes sp.]